MHDAKSTIGQPLSRNQSMKYRTAHRLHSMQKQCGID